MSIKRSLLLAGILFFTSSSLSTHSFAQTNPNYHKSRTRPVIPFKHLTLAAPPGMVYIPGGSVTIKYSQSSTDTNSKKRVSLSSFYIDKTEVTNQQYRLFTQWVIDSIAVVNYLKDDKYFLDPPAGGVKDEAAKSDIAKTDTTGGVVKDTLPTALGGDIHTPTVTTTPTTTATATTTGTMSPTTAKTDTVAVRPVRRRINWAKVKHSEIFEGNDDEIKAKIAPMFDVNTGKIRQELYVFNFTYLKATGTNRNAKIGEYTTEPINIYPDEKIWFKDLNNSQVEILVENYFTQPPFDDYPVVGVTWKQARAFAYWRSITNSDYSNIADYLKYYRLQYSLPSEAQWVYAAGKEMKMPKFETKPTAPTEDTTPVAAAATTSTMTPTASTDSAKMMGAPSDSAALAGLATTTTTDQPKDNSNDEGSGKKGRKHRKHKKDQEEEASSEDNGGQKVITMSKPDKDATPVDRDKNGNLLVNFKQEEGDYTEDGANFTLPVMSYAPNEFGVYNMVGNVAEWVLDAYSPSTFAFVSDVNPVLLYDADSTDADAMKRKVVRGGSFVSNAKALSPFTRDFELQNIAHCYIGFRCVMSAPDILNKSVATRRKETSAQKPSTNGKKK
jgi:formylglycine-generating enzyme required for sulfatase activity